MAYTDIDFSADYFNTTAYTGDGIAGRNLTTGTFQPDLVWIKSRSDTDNHRLVDAVRGATKHLESDNNGAEQTSSNVTAFTSTGITLSSNGAVNANAETYVSWNWKAGGTGVSNTDGSITSTVSANTTSGFSIVSYTGNGTGGATIGHGLSSALSVVIIKRRNTTGEWVFGCSSLGFTKFMEMNSTGAVQTNSTRFNDTAPTSSVFSVGTAVDTNTNGGTYVAYCFAEKKGFSKFGKYTGNGSADGTFVYTGMRPAMVIIKRTDSAGTYWSITDNKRDTYNVTYKRLFTNTSDAENTGLNPNLDFYSNGFKLRSTDSSNNASGGTYIYMAFAESPFTTSTGIPTTAR